MLGLEGRSSWNLIAAMMAGVATFAVAYAFLDRTAFWRRLMANPATRNSIYTAYGLRLIASIIFPVGVFNDMWIFLVLGGIISETLGVMTGYAEPWSTFSMTISQGLALNLQVAIAVATLTAFFRIYGSSRVQRYADG